MEPTHLTAVAEQQLELARKSRNGRSAHTVHGGQGHTLRQTVLALSAGSELGEHDSPGEATLHVLQGHVLLTTASGGRSQGRTGDHLAIPSERHSLAAVEDSAVLLTVVSAR